jgi:hypothetical protein
MQKNATKSLQLLQVQYLKTLRFHYVIGLLQCTCVPLIKKEFSSLQLSRDLQITQKTAWFLLHRIREMLANNETAQLDGNIEIDETFVGGKNKNTMLIKRLRVHRDVVPLIKHQL